MRVGFTGFDPSLFEFLRELAANNDREWFAEHKERYEALVREPALEFITALGDPLERFAPHFLALPKRMGGSLMRVYRDTRFGRDKSPYKTNVGIQFRHEMGKDVHAPGYYVHIEPGRCFLGVGMWHPERGALAAVRDAIVERPTDWKRARDAKALEAAGFALGGSALQRPPRGYPAEHRFVEDLKRKDFIAVADLSDAQVTSRGFVGDVAGRFKAATPLMRFLCTAVDVPY